MRRFRMGKKMLSILQVLNDLKDPEEHGYHEATHGIEQTEIILRAEGITPYTERRKWGWEMVVVPEEKLEEKIKEIEAMGKQYRVRPGQTGLQTIDYWDHEYDHAPPQMKVASALMGKRIGQSAAPYNFMGRIMAVRLSLEHPEMKDSPVVKKHFDWVDELHEGTAKANRKYASYSRSLKTLLDEGMITSDWHLSINPSTKVRHHRARYRITEKGKEALEHYSRASS